MPKNKDLKRLARSRMRKTGESYTTARAQLLHKKNRPSPTVVPESEFASLTGMSDEAVRDGPPILAPVRGDGGPSRPSLRP